LGLSRLVRAQFGEPVTRDGTVTLKLRWEATGPGGSLFPALDADITLTATGAEATLLRLDGAYRPPFGPLGARLDQAILHRAAAATIQSFLRHVAGAIISPAPREQQAARLTEIPRAAPQAEET